MNAAGRQDKKFGHVLRTASRSATCSCCRDAGERRPALAVARLDPRDYAGLNMGPDVACSVALCWDCLDWLLPWLKVPAPASPRRPIEERGPSDPLGFGPFPLAGLDHLVGASSGFGRVQVRP